ncbi:helix-turn-helix domain-containing protein [Terriglobus roseus]|uniref:Helix-turn-helix domain-containing protein n=1 Tax=Terriglobus roseus TaxID=392734 RepID=A0A1H4J9Y5_9BACT|nr:AraC family transcriptional regulator [Terriglobus roseus]SEB43073.1 Helix-turn-helix domain-containing protein [Terriglobus roseus]
MLCEVDVWIEGISTVAHLASQPSPSTLFREEDSRKPSPHVVLRRRGKSIDIWVSADSALRMRKTRALQAYQTFFINNPSTPKDLKVHGTGGRFHCPSDTTFKQVFGLSDLRGQERLKVCVSRDLIEDATDNPQDFRFVDDIVARELTLALTYSHAGRAPAGSDTRQYILEALCERLQTCSSSSVEPNDGASDPFHAWQLVVIQEALDNAGNVDVSVEAVAKRCRLSGCHFARRFRLTFGTSFHRHIVQARVARSRVLLSTTSRPISQIALDVGFGDQSSFTRCFTNAIGIPPGRWRAITAGQKSFVGNC